MVEAVSKIGFWANPPEADKNRGGAECETDGAAVTATDGAAVTATDGAAVTATAEIQQYFKDLTRGANPA
jgi:hypothetical protein